MYKRQGITPLTGISPPDVAKLSTHDLAEALKMADNATYGSPLTPKMKGSYNYVTKDIAKNNINRRLSGAGSTQDMNQPMKVTNALEGPIIGFRSPALAGLRAYSSHIAGGTDEGLGRLMRSPAEFARSVAEVLRERMPETLGKRLDAARMLAVLTSGVNNTFLKDHSDAQR